MDLRKVCRALTIALWGGVLAWQAAAVAGPDWDENTDGGGDAGALPNAAQTIAGFGMLQSITGSLSGSGFGPTDFQDVYLIRISEPSAFIAATTVSFGGSADFNTQLWLFDPLGLGILGNDDTASTDVQSILRSSATDGSGAAVTTAGLYYLGISGFNSDPLSVTGPIFNQINPTEISGPDGSGGSQPLTSWDSNGQTGDYLIFLSGASFVETCLGDLNFDGLVDSADLAILLANWGTCPNCVFDLSDDDVVDGTDLAVLLGNWGPC